MVTRFSRPRIVVSRCLGFAACRYDGSVIRDPVVSSLAPYVEFLPVCPEVEIGLGVPRPPVRLVGKIDPRLVQPDTGKDWTLAMQEFSSLFLEGVKDVDGFILKNRSPSCALRDAKLYPAMEKTAAVGRGPGLFGKAVLQRFPGLPAEDEGRLTNRDIRDHFLTALFALAALREVEKSGDLGQLVLFHTRYKLLLMAQSQRMLMTLGRMVANAQGLTAREVLSLYRSAFRAAFHHPPRRPSVLNVLMHAFGYVSPYLKHEERQYFLDLLAQYRAHRLPLSVPREVLRSWIIRFDVEYLAQQAFFQPFPPELVLPLDSGGGAT